MYVNFYLLRYNNYSNRIVKRLETFSDYQPYIIASIENIYNFNFADGVMTSQILNNTNELNGEPDYALVCDTQNNIVSRWFVLETTYLRNGQYEIALRRDLFADYKDKLMRAPAFIEKATVDAGDPAIFNQEQMTFNQIKVGEDTLKDETGVPWIVGYCASRNGEPDEEIRAEFMHNLAIQTEVARIQDFELYKYSNLATTRTPLNIEPNNITYSIYARHGNDLVKVAFDEQGAKSLGKECYETPYIADEKYGYGHTRLWNDTQAAHLNTWPVSAGNTSLRVKWLDEYDTGFRFADEWTKAFQTKFTAMRSQVNTLLNTTNEIELLKHKDEVVYDRSAQKYYRIRITKKYNITKEISAGTGALYQSFVSGYNQRKSNFDATHPSTWNSQVVNNSTPNNYSFSVIYTAPQYEVTIKEWNLAITETGYYISLGTSTSRYHLPDAPYDMFAMPFADGISIYQNGKFVCLTNKNLTIAAINELMRSTNTIYDVQLLPYCPVRYALMPDGSIDIGDFKIGVIRPMASDITMGVIMYGLDSSFSFSIPYTIEKSNEPKIAALTEFYRLASPNYNGQFEFNAEKNGGVTSFNVDCSYKPFNPYIHINPDFSGLYGQDFNDARGLICGGDFSLPQTTDQWKQYELQNKNYEKSFQRNIESMEIQQRAERISESVGIFAGALNGAASGAKIGSVVPGIGTAVGAGVGAVASLAGGMVQQWANADLRKEELQLAKDQFGYSMGNIKALPYSLSKVSAFNANNKLFPILEHYSSTDIEKQALRDKVKWNGMTVMRIGTVNSFLRAEPSYIKGRFIRMDDLEQDYHTAVAINDEFNKGVYI